MGKLDKDRHQKELALRYCLAHGLIPFPEVLVKSRSDVSDTIEDLTDIDVLGIGATADGNLTRTIFDCKTTNKMSAINRAFWAAGLRDYVSADYAFVILKGRAVYNHRLSALAINVDLHDESSFQDLGRALDPNFPAETHYQSSLKRWDAVQAAYEKFAWSAGLYGLVRNSSPLTDSPWSVFRRIIAELANTKGHFDPARTEHESIFLDALASVLLLWVSIARDVRRFYEPGMKREQFEKVLRYYLWGGRESYGIRQQLKERSVNHEDRAKVELSNWNALVSFAGIVVSGPSSIFDCAMATRELTIRAVSDAAEDLDENFRTLLDSNNRIRQFTLAMADYLTIAAGLPREFSQKVAAGLSLQTKPIFSVKN